MGRKKQAESERVCFLYRRGIENSGVLGAYHWASRPMTIRIGRCRSGAYAIDRKVAIALRVGHRVQVALAMDMGDRHRDLGRLDPAPAAAYTHPCCTEHSCRHPPVCGGACARDESPGTARTADSDNVAREEKLGDRAPALARHVSGFTVRDETPTHSRGDRKHRRLRDQPCLLGGQAGSKQGTPQSEYRHRVRP